MASVVPVLRRALLYVPGSSQKMIEKSRGLVVDNVTYDLEDSVTMNRKDEARSYLASFLNGPRARGIGDQAVRINSVSSGLAEKDLLAVLDAKHIDTIVVPKVDSPSDLYLVRDILSHKLPHRHPPTSQQSSASSSDSRASDTHSKPIQILALIESARSLASLPQICSASPYLSGLIFAAEDFAVDLSITRTPSLSEFAFARSSIVTYARANNLPSVIDLVCTSFRGDGGLRTLEEECLGGMRMGFNGKQCIHPSQVEVVQKAFGPGDEEVEWAMRVLVGDEKAIGQGRGAWTLDGKMIDAPVVGKARSVVAKAEACGWDIGKLRDKWKGQEPE
ncbi:hypothetical protein MMC25_004558 [Agyrium rufum]|nr:hypothetical protein [Agyrium rufum]